MLILILFMSFKHFMTLFYVNDILSSLCAKTGLIKLIGVTTDQLLKLPNRSPMVECRQVPRVEASRSFHPVCVFERYFKCEDVVEYRVDILKTVCVVNSMIPVCCACLCANVTAEPVSSLRRSHNDNFIDVSVSCVFFLV